MKTFAAEKKNVKLLPHAPGVYMFRDDQKVIYIGKAKNLFNRVGSYFMKDLELKTSRMVASAKTISYIPVESEFEALLLEAKLVNKNKPKYNIELRDDKSPLYIGITRDELPRVILLRQKELASAKLKNVYGPFINSTSPKLVLKMIRRIFPFGTHKPTKRACVDNQIGLCNPCPSEVLADPSLRREYLLNIRRTNAILSGKSKQVLLQLQSSRDKFSKEEKFEEAREVSSKIRALEYTVSRRELNDSYLENPNLLEDIRKKETDQLGKIINKFIKTRQLRRIECFDIAHLSGTYPTASMVTFVDGEPDKSLYRHYKVSEGIKNDDPGSMKSVLERRKYRFDSWGKPDLIIVDGGRGQLSAALEVLGNSVPVVGLAKKLETLIFMTDKGFEEFVLPESSAKKLVQRIRDEAHRFARSYHHKLVSRAIRESK